MFILYGTMQYVEYWELFGFNGILTCKITNGYDKNLP